jgi:hypothetical protein
MKKVPIGKSTLWSYRTNGCYWDKVASSGLIIFLLGAVFSVGFFGFQCEDHRPDILTNIRLGLY